MVDASSNSVEASEENINKLRSSIRSKPKASLRALDREIYINQSRVVAIDKLWQRVLSPLRGSDLIMDEYPRLVDSPWA
jgi:hypothetical protein